MADLDTITAADLTEYLVGVFKVLTGDNIQPAISERPALAEPVNDILKALSPYVAYYLVHYSPKRQTNALKAEAKQGPGDSSERSERV